MFSVVIPKSLNKYNYYFQSCVEFGTPSDAETITEDKEVNLGSLAEEGNLSNAIVDGVYYAVDANNGDGYSKDEGCLVLNSTMTEEDMNSMQYDGVFPCLKSLDKNPIPWDICWEIAIYKAGGLCLTPYHTLVRNIGLDSGTHFRGNRWLQRYEFDREPLNHAIVITHQTAEKDEEKEQLFKLAIRDWGIRYTWLGKTLRFIYKKYKQIMRK